MKFPKTFFDEEVRDDFTIASMMKRAWAAELEVLQVIDSVCAKHNLKWYAIYGTLLGAVRHKGFIPWDDDIDICMMRSDYMKFMEVAPKELQEGFVISGIYGDSPRLWDANRESQGRVIADEMFFSLPEYMNYFHAFPYMRIGIDIFPLDNLPSDPAKQLELIHKFYDLQIITRQWGALKEKNQLASRLGKYEDELGITFDKEDETRSIHEIMSAMDRYASSVPDDGSNAVADIMYLELPDSEDTFHGYSGMKKEWFGESREMPYECVSMKVPCDPDMVLRALFGDDYMTPKKFTAGHEYPFYRTQEEAFIKMLKDAGNVHTVDEFCANWHKMIGET